MSDQNDANKRLHDSDQNDDSLFGKEAERDLSSSPIQVFDSFGDKDEGSSQDAFAQGSSGSTSAKPYTATNPYQQAYGQGGSSSGASSYAGSSANPYASAQSGTAQQPGSMPPYQPYSGGQASGGFGTSGGQPYSGQPYSDGMYGGQPGGQTPSTGKATGALVCGILAIVFSGSVLLSLVLGIAAIVLAGSYLKSGGTAGTAKAGRVCGIVGIVFSAISLIFYIVVGVAVVQEAFDDYDDIYDYNSGYSSTQTPYSGSNIYDAEEQAAIDAANVQMDKLAAGDQATLEAIAAMVNEDFAEAMEMPMEDCGIDPLEYARLMTAGFAYEVSIVVADESSGSGFVSYDVRCRDVFDVIDEFNDDLSDLQYSGDAQLMSDAQLQQRIGELFMEAVNDADMEDELYMSLDMSYVDNAWTVDQATWDSELDYLFGLS